MKNTNAKKATASYKTSYEEKSKNDNVTQPLLTAPCIDKLSIIVPNITDEQYIKGVEQNLWNAVKFPELGLANAKKALGYKTCMTINHVPNTKTLVTSSPLLLQLDHYNKSRPQIRMEWNPAKMTYEFSNQVDDIFQVNFGFGFYEILGKSKITRIDLAVDIFNMDLESLLVKVKNKRIARTFFNQDGEIATMTFGGSKGNQYVLYSKSEQMGVANFGSTVRIEARMRPKGLWMKNIADMANPLSAVQIFNLDCIDNAIDNGFWNAFRDSCRYRGVNNALKLQSGKIKAKLKKAVNENSADWWNPELFWGEHWINILDDCEFLDLPACPDLTYANAAGENK